MPILNYLSLAVRDYQESRNWYAINLGLKVEFVDMTDLGKLEAAIAAHRPKMIWVETPTNPTLKLVDLAAVAKLGKACGAVTVCDNTFMTPFFQRPLDLGMDVVVHSTTKYLNGHSDVVGGFIGTRDGALARLKVACIFLYCIISSYIILYIFYLCN